MACLLSIILFVLLSDVVKVLSLQDFRSQLLVEEAILESFVSTSLMTTMVAQSGSTYPSGPHSYQSQGFALSSAHSQVSSSRFK